MRLWAALTGGDAGKVVISAGDHKKISEIGGYLEDSLTEMKRVLDIRKGKDPEALKLETRHWDRVHEVFGEMTAIVRTILDATNPQGGAFDLLGLGFMALRVNRIKQIFLDEGWVEKVPDAEGKMRMLRHFERISPKPRVAMAGVFLTLLERVEALDFDILGQYLLREFDKLNKGVGVFLPALQSLGGKIKHIEPDEIRNVIKTIGGENGKELLDKFYRRMVQRELQGGISIQKLTQDVLSGGLTGENQEGLSDSLNGLFSDFASEEKARQATGLIEAVQAASGEAAAEPTQQLLLLLREIGPVKPQWLLDIEETLAHRQAESAEEKEIPVSAATGGMFGGAAVQGEDGGAEALVQEEGAEVEGEGAAPGPVFSGLG